MSATAPPTRLAYLDGWRGVSLVLVLVGHFTDLSRWVAPFGVEMFFVLSGRLMAELLIVRRQPLRIFLWRRMTRVWPALWAYIGLVASGLAVAAWWGDRRNVIAGALASLTFTQNYVSAHVSVPYFDHHWSLAVEEHCYLLLALLAAIAARRSVAAAALALLVTALAWLSGWTQVVVIGDDPYFTYLQTDTRAGSVLLPFALHLAAQSRRGRAGLTHLPWLAPVALASAAVCAAATPIGPLRYTAGTAALALGVVAIDTAPAMLRRWLMLPWLTWIGAASFSLYLWQQPFMMLARAGAPPLPCLAAALAVGLWSFYRVERPARRTLNALGQRHHATPRPSYA